MGISLFILFCSLGRAEMQWRQLKKFCKVKKMFGMMLVNGNKILEKAEKKKRDDTHMTLQEIACRNILEMSSP